MTPPLIDVYRSLQERDVVWHSNQVWACVRITDCSAKLVPISGDWKTAQVNEVGSGIRVCTDITVGDPSGLAKRDPRDWVTFWLVGRLGQDQIVRTQVADSRYKLERVAIGYVDVPMPGFAPRAPKRKKVAVEVEGGPSEMAEPALATASADWLVGALEQAALQLQRAVASSMSEIQMSSDPVPG